MGNANLLIKSEIAALVVQSLHGMIFGRSEVSTTTRRYIESSFTKPPFNRCSIRINIGHPDAMFISFLPGRWKELERGSGRKLSLWCFFPAWLMSVRMTFWRKGQGSSASYGPHMITKKKSSRIFHYMVILCHW